MSLAKGEPRRRAAPTGIILLATVACFWGLAWPTMKIVLDEMPALAFRSLCCACAGPAGLLIARLAGDRIRLPRAELAPLLLVAALNVTLWQICIAYGLQSLSAGRASIIAYTMPAWATLFGWLFLKERVRGARLAGLGLGTAGLAVLLVPDFHHLIREPLGVLLMLVASASWAGGTVGMKYFRWSLSVIQNTAWQFILGGIPIVLAALVTGSMPHFDSLSTPALASLLYVIAIPILFCQWAWFKAVEILPGSISAMGTLAIPVIGTLSGALLLGEPLDLWELVALALVVAGLALVAWRPSAKYRLLRGRESRYATPDRKAP